MHPEIKKYFDQFTDSYATTNKGLEVVEHWMIIKDWYSTIAIKNENDGIWWYYVCDKWFPENEALKVIKLTAWL